MPSSHKARQAMFQLADDTGDGSIYDLGSGWGHLVIRLAKRYPQRQIVGYELSLLPWFTALVLKRMLGLNNLSLHRENFLKADLSQASVVMCYLYPAVMEGIKEKLSQEGADALFLISHNFALNSQSALKVIQLNDFYRSPVYLYQLNKLNAQA
ncbi:MAG: 16S rRNA A1518/A1519 N6-dimethyltransferase RsmA/KsgA/DIM1 with predicted DNA glycosylase [Oleiphilaceae bacterium]|jgi:16S rRNA A1518/A1519 N6-dimethyltransferase RsmA/KsgA/DIM1 with predicted DNA glycosylase/AP lyase activity